MQGTDTEDKGHHGANQAGLGERTEEPFPHGQQETMAQHLSPAVQATTAAVKSRTEPRP